MLIDPEVARLMMKVDPCDEQSWWDTWSDINDLPVIIRAEPLVSDDDPRWGDDSGD